MAAHRVLGVVLDVAQSAGAARVVEARQTVEDPHGPRLRDHVEDDGNGRRPRAGDHDQPGNEIEILFTAQSVDDQEKEQNTERQLTEIADRGRRRRGGAETVGKREDSQKEEDQQGNAQHRSHQVWLPAAWQRA